MGSRRRDPCRARGCESSTRALPPQHDLRSLEQDHQIEQKTAILDVVEIVLQFLERVFVGGPVAVAELRPSGDAGLHRVTLAVVWDFLTQLCHESRSLGTRTDEAHVA